MAQTTVQGRVQLGQVLLAKGLIDQVQLDQVLAEQQLTGHRQLLGEILIQKGICTDEQVVCALAECLGVPYVKVTPRMCDPKVVEVLPRQFCQDHAVLPLFRVHTTLTVAVSDPTDLFLVDQIEHITGYKVQLVCSAATDILATLRAYSPTAGAFILDESLPGEYSADVSVVQPSSAKATDLDASQQAANDLIHYILNEAVSHRARFIYIEPQDRAVRIRLRVDGGIIERARPPLQMHQAIVSRLRQMAGLQQAAGQGRATVRVFCEGRPLDLCITITSAALGDTAVVRLGDPQTELLGLESLGFTVSNLQAVRQVLDTRSGLFVISGPPGSGKKTTARAMLLATSLPQLYVCTIEDPIEYIIPSVSQFQPDRLQMVSTFRLIMQNDPDVVMITSLDDPELARAISYTATSNRFMIVVMDGLGVETAISRLLDMGVPGALLADVLAGVLGQRLVGKLCCNCRQAYKPDEVLRDRIGQEVCVYRSSGCGQCNNSGFLGKIGLHELVIPGPNLRHAIIQRAPARQLRLAAIQDGMAPIGLDGIEKVKAGIIPVDPIAGFIESDKDLLASIGQLC